MQRRPCFAFLEVLLVGVLATFRGGDAFQLQYKFSLSRQVAKHNGIRIPHPFPWQLHATNIPSSCSDSSIMDPATTKFVVIGCGPAGLLSALAIAKETGDPSRVVVYEARDYITSPLEVSYAIGLNPRGLGAIEAFSPQAAQEIRQAGKPLSTFDVHVQGRRVGQVKVGQTLGHTRTNIVETLYKYVVREGIQVRKGHALTGLNLRERKLTFNTKQGTEVEVDCGNSVVVAADGAGSTTRSLLESEATRIGDVRYLPVCNEKVPWNVYFRALIMDGPAFREKRVPLNSSVQGIYDDIFAACVNVQGEPRWSLVIPCVKDSTDTEWFFSDGEVPVMQATSTLRRFLAAKVPKLHDTDQYFTDDEIKAFFSRRPVTGAVIKLKPLSYPHNQHGLQLGQPDEPVEKPWIVFFGDSAHSGFPAVGEGLNSSLEDVLVFARTVLWPALGDPRATTPKSDYLDLSVYSSVREPDVDALCILAKEYVTLGSGKSREKAEQTATMILSSIGRSIGLLGPSESELRYDPDTTKEFLGPLHEIVHRHLQDTYTPRILASFFVSNYFALASVIRDAFALLQRPTENNSTPTKDSSAT